MINKLKYWIFKKACSKWWVTLWKVACAIKWTHKGLNVSESRLTMDSGTRSCLLRKSRQVSLREKQTEAVFPIQQTQICRPFGEDSTKAPRAHHIGRSIWLSQSNWTWWLDKKLNSCWEGAILCWTVTLRYTCTAPATSNKEPKPKDTTLRWARDKPHYQWCLMLKFTYSDKCFDQNDVQVSACTQ